MLPLKIAILWHQHQPFYEYENQLLLPWTRLHGIKDYADLPQLLFEFPNIKQTFNIVPSMALQIIQYYENKAFDNIQELTLKAPSELSIIEKKEVLRLFFLANYDNMIAPYPRFLELYNQSKIEAAENHFSEQDWLDLQVWYNLSWFGPFSQQKPAIKRLFIKQRNYSDLDKKIVLELSNEILESIFKIYSILQELEQVEISFSPFYHPILPLLCDTNSALQAMPYLKAPNPNFSYPEDAKYQIAKGKDFITNLFKKTPQGMWPSEGSISDKCIELFINEGLTWFATDEGILRASGGIIQESDKYFPRKVISKNSFVSGIFRDHSLSDAIGFEYSKWNPDDAANDFINKLNRIKEQIIAEKGESALEYAVVPIILDGENCWEFYKNNGFDFLRALYNLLSQPNFQTITMSEACNMNAVNYLPEINSLRAGSWIDSNFRIWIDGEKNKQAWEELTYARKAFQESNIDDKHLAYNELLIAEGSDWFWWYCDDHQVENKMDFDKIFRYRLRNVYKFLKIEYPERLNYPIGANSKLKQNSAPKAFQSPIIPSNLDEWKNAGEFYLSGDMTAMHKVGEILDYIKYCQDENHYYFGFSLKRDFTKEDEISLIINELNAKIIISSNNFNIQNLNGVEILVNNFIFVKLLKMHNHKKLEFIIESQSESNKYNYIAHLDFNLI